MHSQFPDIDTEVATIAPTALKRRLDDGESVTLLDTRQPAAFETWRITHPNLIGVNVPFPAFLDETGTEPASAVPSGVPPDPLVVSCGKGISSQYVAAFLASNGRDVLALEHGIEGWAELNETRELSARVVQFHRPSSGCLAYLLIAGDEAAVVDPLRTFAGEYAAAAADRGATLRYAIDTHVHADHVSGIRAVANETGAEPVAPAGAVDRGLSYAAALVEAGDRLPLGETAVIAQDLAGHTTETTGYRFDDVLLTGDSVFLDGVARPDLEDQSRAEDAAGQLWETIQAIGEREDGLIIAPGHVGSATDPGSNDTYTARLAALRERLPAFGESRTVFVDRVTTGLPPRPANDRQIIAVNLGRETADAETAFELELGPSNCAAQA